VAKEKDIEAARETVIPSRGDGRQPMTGRSHGGCRQKHISRAFS
jgi:hypothetical protein